MTLRRHPVLSARCTLLCAAVAASLMLTASAASQSVSAASPPARTAEKPATAKSSTATPPAAAKPHPIHLTTAYPVQRNPDGTETLVKPAPAATKPQSSAQTPAPATTGTAPAIPATTATPPKPPAPPNSAVNAEYLATLPPARFNQRTIVIDAAHGGNDSGARIADTILEKDVDLALAFRLKSLLQARGFNVITTRDSDNATEPGNPGSPLTLDDRAAIANRAGAAACILIHATGSGRGVHLYTSELDARPGQTIPTPWLTAQAAWVSQSQRLAGELATALARERLPLVSSHASVRPVDSLTCPALVLELAPDNTDQASINDSDYQQRVATAVAGALIFWQNHVKPPARILPTPPPDTSSTGVGDSGAQP